MDDRWICCQMVNNSKQKKSTVFWITFKMFFYLIFSSFIIFIAVPLGFHKIGKLVFSSNVFSWLEPGTAQKITGAVLLITGFCSYLVCSLWLVISGRGPFVEFDPPQKLVCSGPYRWTRNPMATLILVSILGEAVFFGSPGILTLFIIGILIAHLQVILIEEPLLRKRFGKDYSEYLERVPRWLPSLKKSRL